MERKHDSEKNEQVVDVPEELLEQISGGEGPTPGLTPC